MSGYRQQDLQRLSDVEYVRKRPAMYIGDTTVRGVNQLVLETVDNVADLFLAGTATQVDVQIDHRVIGVSDDGPGLPFDLPCDETASLAAKYLTCMHRTPTADNHWPHLHFNGFGCGLFLVTALADTMIVRSWRDGQRWQQTFQRGEAIEAMRVIERGQTRGTTICFSPDPEIFGKHVADPLALERKFKVISHLLPGFTLTLNNQIFHAPGGLADWASEIVGATRTRPLSITRQVGDFHFQMAAAGTASDETEWITFANGNEMIEGGTHLIALQRLLRKAKWKPAVALLHVTMQSPQFAGPTRGKLDVPGVDTPMKEALETEIVAYCQSLAK